VDGLGLDLYRDRDPVRPSARLHQSSGRDILRAFPPARYARAAPAGYGLRAFSWKRKWGRFTHGTKPLSPGWLAKLRARSGAATTIDQLMEAPVEHVDPIGPVALGTTWGSPAAEAGFQAIPRSLAVNGW